MHLVDESIDEQRFVSHDHRIATRIQNNTFSTNKNIALVEIGDSVHNLTRIQDWRNKRTLA